MSGSAHDDSYLRRLVRRAQKPLKRPYGQRSDEIAPLVHAEIHEHDLTKTRSNVPKMVRNDNDPARPWGGALPVSTPKASPELTPETSFRETRAQKVFQTDLTSKLSSESALRETTAQQVSQPNIKPRKIKPDHKVTADNQINHLKDLQGINSQNSDRKTHSKPSSKSLGDPTNQASPDTKKSVQTQSTSQADITAQRQVQKRNRQSQNTVTPHAVSELQSPETPRAESSRPETPRLKTKSSLNDQASTSKPKKVNSDPQLRQISSLKENPKKTFNNKSQTQQKTVASRGTQLKSGAHKDFISQPIQNAPFQDRSVQKNSISQLSNNRQTVRNYSAPSKTAESGSLHIGQVNIVVKSSTPDIPAPVQKSQNRPKAPVTAPALKNDNRRYRKRF